VKIDVTIPPKFFNKGVTLVATPTLTYQGGETAFAAQTLQGEAVQGNGTVVPYEEGKTISYTGKVPYEDAMRLSDLVVKIQASKGKKSADFDPVKVADGIVATATLVNNSPAVIVGKDQFVRITPEQTEAAIYYLINSSQVRNNQLTSEEIKALEQYLKNANQDESIRVNNIEVRSYASPDGSLNWNERLVNKREASSQAYLEKSMKKNKMEEYKDASFLKKNVVSEDWDGFRTAMEASSIRDKELILRVLSMQTDPEAREKEIKNVASAYSTIADQILPKLRRSKFVVNAERVGKSDEELVDLSMSNPASLTAEELLYAATLFENQSGKLAVYESVKSQYPNDWRGFNDAGMVLFETGKAAQAKVDFDKANELSANNPIVKNNLGAIELQNGNIAEAEVLFGAATGSGDEVNYNKGIIAIMKGDYKNAVSLFGNCTCSNAALASMLDGNNSEALKKLEAGKEDSALASYLKAVIGARTNDSAMVMSNLKDAVAKDVSFKRTASTDIEFAAFFDNEEFKGIVQ
jgi:tetratricopeptide (TPR) repeat protein